MRNAFQAGLAIFSLGVVVGRNLEDPRPYRVVVMIALAIVATLYSHSVLQFLKGKP